MYKHKIKFRKFMWILLKKKADSFRFENRWRTFKRWYHYKKAKTMKNLVGKTCDQDNLGQSMKEVFLVQIPEKIREFLDKKDWVHLNLQKSFHLGIESPVLNKYSLHLKNDFINIANLKWLGWIHKIRSCLWR